MLVVATLALAGCATQDAAQYHQWGIQAERARDYSSAERNYERALQEAREARVHPSNIAMFEYNLGRVKGYLCKYDEAERLLVSALEVQEKAGAENRMLTMRLFELGRLHFDRGNHAAALPYYARGIRLATRLGAESADPIGLANAIDEYALALERTGDAAKAAQERGKARELRAINPGKAAVAEVVRYSGPCPAQPGSAAAPGQLGPRTDGKAAVMRLRRATGSLDLAIGEDLAAIQLIELNEWLPPRSMWQSREFEIAAGANRIGLRATSMTRVFPSQQYVHRHLCLEFVAEAGRVYTVAVGDHQRDWVATVTVGEANDRRAVPAKSRVLPFDGNSPLSCRRLQ